MLTHPDTVSLDELDPGIREMLNYFASGEPETYDYTVSNIAGNDADIGNWCISNISNLLNNIKSDGYSEGLLGLCVDDMHSKLLNVADNETARIKGIRDRGEVQSKYNGMLPSKKVRTGVFRVRRRGDNYRLDKTLDVYLHDRIDPDSYNWSSFTGYFYDEDMLYRRWDRFNTNQYAVIRPSKKQIMGFKEWRAFRMDNEVMQSLVSLVIDTSNTNMWMPEVLGKLLRKQEPLSEADFPISDKKIDQLIDGTHEDVVIRASTVGLDGNVVLMDFISRNDRNSIAILSIVFGKDNITKPYIVVRRDLNSSINHCSLRSYYDNGDVRHYALFRRVSHDRVNFRLMTFLTELQFTHPTSDVFTYVVPDGWSHMDLVNVNEGYATLYKSNGETEPVEMVALDDPSHPTNARNRNPLNVQSIYRVALGGVIAAAFVSLFVLLMKRK